MKLKLIKTIYGMLFAVLVLHPHFVDHIGPIARPYAQSIVILFLSGITYAIYRLHQPEIRKNATLQEDLQVSEGKMVEAFAYIGSVNRRLSLFKHLSSDLLAESKFTERSKKTIFDNLLAVAVTSISKVRFGLFRFVDIHTGRTVKEFWNTRNGDTVAIQQVGNRELLVSRRQTANIKRINGYSVIATSDREASVQGFLVLFSQNGDLKDEYLLLQAVADQSQLFYKYLFV